MNIASILSASLALALLAGCASARHRAAVNSGAYNKTYDQIYREAEERHAARRHLPQQQPLTVPARHIASAVEPLPTFQAEPQQSFDQWDQQRKQEQFMERQTEALEGMQREDSWNNFERGYLGQ